MFKVGSIVGSKYLVVGPCSDSGGMGSLVYVTYIGTTGPIFVLKYCKLTGPEILARFRREVRLMQQFSGNPYVMPIMDANLEHIPPFFVMPYFESGDLKACSPFLRQDLVAQELYFNRMIDCVAELHRNAIMHRDIKPQNFLVGQGKLVVADLGLCTEAESTTAFTNSIETWGTEGFLPPEFSNGGFKYADPAGDIFMLGKTLYAILSDRNPTYLTPEGIPPQLFPILERCCASAKSNRYQSLDQLRQSLKVAFDVMLGRAIGSGAAYDGLRQLIDMTQGTAPFSESEIVTFIDRLRTLDDSDKIQMCLELPRDVFTLLQQEFVPEISLSSFLSSYRLMADTATYEWSFAEVIASNMKVLFSSVYLSNTNKAEAFIIAAIGAHRQHRFAAMDTCAALIETVTDPDLAQRIHDLMLFHSFDFLGNLEQKKFRAPAIRAAIDMIKRKTEARWAAAAQNQI